MTGDSSPINTTITTVFRKYALYTPSSGAGLALVRFTQHQSISNPSLADEGLDPPRDALDFVFLGVVKLASLTSRLSCEAWHDQFGVVPSDVR